jgi:hypothetical protein
LSWGVDEIAMLFHLVSKRVLVAKHLLRGPLSAKGLLLKLGVGQCLKLIVQAL